MTKWGDIVGGTGTVLTSLLSCAFCPMCLPLYAAFLSLIGIEVTGVQAYFFPFMILFSLLSLSIMAYQTYTHRGVWIPFVFAMIACLGMITCAYQGYEYLLYVCVFFFMGSILWNKKRLTHEGRKCC